MTTFTNPAGRAPDAAAGYVRSILALLGERDPLEVQSRLLDELRAALAGLSESALHRPEAPGKWSIAGVVQHLADSEVVIGWRLRLVLGQDRPPITGFDQDGWAQGLDYAHADVPAALRLLAANREANLALLRRLTPAQWAREGEHSERGPESVALMAKLYAGHDLAHLAQIRRIRAAVEA